ncbi:alpha/beta fold hydrolase [Roseomonas elaeocarpi]|uniref:Alpha/beta fold hydrolase n=1 Tax=Roseomonas elaeocarpi TaxID=907779 RepID=A0ABV6JM86_9PROT
MSLRNRSAEARETGWLMRYDAVRAGFSVAWVATALAVGPAASPALVYVAALAPDGNETLSEVRSRFAPATNNVIKSADGFLTLDPATFHDDFAADLPAADAAFMARSQVPVSEKALSAPVSQAAWRSKPSWYAVATEDHKINPDFGRFMARRTGSTTVEVKGIHAVYVSQPRAIAALIEQAATGARKE